MSNKIIVRLVGGRADGQRVEVEDMQDGWPFRAAVIAEDSMSPSSLSGPKTCSVEANYHFYKLASVRDGTQEFRFGIPDRWDNHDAFAHLFGPSRWRN